MASIDPVIIDPDDIYIYLKVFAQYDPGTSSNTSDIKSNIQSGINDWATQTQINNFNSTFRSSAFEKAVSLSDKSISDVSVQLSLLRYIKPITNQTNTYCVLQVLNCMIAILVILMVIVRKNLSLLSGTFRTADRPGVDQQFEDDGFGNLRTFYNTGNKKVYTNNAAGTVNYLTGEICFGPINVIGAGVNIPTSGISVTDTTTGAGSVIDTNALPTDLSIPVLFIPANVSTIPSSTPGTIINVITPEITVVPVGTPPPPTIPLNSLTPGTFNTTPTTITVGDIGNAGVTTSTCF